MIVRSYCCAQCNYMTTVELRSDQWNEPPPDCPRCADLPLGQEFLPPAIGGSTRVKATDMALDIAEKDYGVADIRAAREDGERTQVRYKDAGPGASTWGASQGAIEQAVALGRQTRQQHGSSLDIIKTMPDLIAESKKKSARIW